MTGVKTITKKALHHLAGHRLVSIQEAVHMVDDQPLVICSDSMTYVNISQGQVLRDDLETDKRKDIITVYRNRQQQFHNLSLEQYFYRVFSRNTFKQTEKDELNEDADKDAVTSNEHRILVPKGMNCTPKYPVDFAYARGMLILHKPWSKDNTLTSILKDQQKTISTFLSMIDKKEVPSSVTFQYHTSMKYARQKKIEILVKQGVNHPDIDEENLDEETMGRLTGWIHNNHFTDNKYNNDRINDMTVDIGQKKDWSISDFKEDRHTTIDGKEYIEQIAKQYYSDIKICKTLQIPTQKDGSEYLLKDLSEQQQAVVLALIDTIVKFLNNDTKYKPLRATVMGCGGTGKSFIINTIISIVRTMTQLNDSILVGAPTGAAAFNVQGSTLHRLLGINVGRPEDVMSETIKENIKSRLTNLLCLMIDERSMLSSKILAVTERNVRECAFKGQNSKEIWGGVPVVLLFGDDYQLFPVIDEGAIQGYSRMNSKVPQTPTTKMTPSQLICQRGNYLFTHVMSETVFTLDINYRVKCKKFRDLLGRLRVGEPTNQDAETLSNLHISNYTEDFTNYLANNKKTMWLYATNAAKELKNEEMLIHTSKHNNVPIARLDCTYDTHRLTKESDQTCACMSHFDHTKYLKHTDLCIGARVAIATVNFLPEVGLYNGTIGNIIEIVYHDRPVGPNDKQHYHLPDYIVVDIPHLKLPSNIAPWDNLHKTVSTHYIQNAKIIFHPLLTLNNSMYLFQ